MIKYWIWLLLYCCNTYNYNNGLNQQFLSSMKSFFYRCAIFVSFLVVPGLVLSQDDWVKFEADEVLTFSIDAPGEMEESSKSIKTAIGDLKALTYAYQGGEDDANYLYLINLVQYPEGTFPKDSVDLVDEYLNSAILTSTEKVNGELVYSAELDYDTGKLFRIKYNDGNAVVKGKAFIKSDVFISLQVFTVKGQSLNREMDYFLDSFKVK